VALSDVAAVDFTPLPSPTQSGPIVRSLIVLDGVTGKQLWRRDKIVSVSPMPLFSTPGTVYLEQLPNPPSPSQCSFSIQALDSRSGTVRWTQSNIPGCADPFYPGFATDASTSVLMYPIASATKIVALDATTGTKYWQQQLPQSAICNAVMCQSALAKATIAGGIVYVAISGRFVYPQGGE
jgi:outer membrane protein assembly factor BamB